MYIPFKNRFRKDLIITNSINKETQAKQYSVKEPISGEIFEFGEEEYFLCKSLDGNSTIPQISAAFQNCFGLTITEEDLNHFSAQIAEFGLLETYHDQAPSSLPVSQDNTQNLLITTKSARTGEEDRELQAEPETQLQEKKSNLVWSLSNPDSLFIFLVRISKHLKLFFQVLTWLLIPGVVLALFILFSNQSELRTDRAVFGKSIPFVFHIILNLVIINLTSKLSQGTIISFYGGTVKEFGLKLRFGIIPRFRLSKKGIWRLKREEQLWVFGTPLLVRLFVFVLGIFVWYLTRTTETGLKNWALSLGYMGLITFIFDSSPLWHSDGFGWLIAYFRLSPKLLRQNLLVWEMMLNRRPLPKHLTSKEKLRLQLFTLVMVIAWAFLAFRISHHMALRLLRSISPGILGEGAKVVLLGVTFVLALRWWLTKLGKTKQSKKQRSQTAGYSRLNESTSQAVVLDESFANIHSSTKKSISLAKITKSWAKHLVKIFLLVGLGILLSLPYPYRTGGAIQLLLPTQQQIQAQVEGKITKVFFNGGDGQWIKAGTVIANMEAVDIENAVLTTQEQIRQQQADVEKQQANLNKLLATPKKEDVEVAQQQVNVAQQQVNVAQQQVNVAKGQLQTARDKAEYSARQTARFKELYDAGALALQQYENAQKRAQIDRNTVEEEQQNLEETKQNVETKKQKVEEAQANLKLVLSGPYPQDIEAARQEVEAARANLKRLQQQLKYHQNQMKRTPLMMPIDGYLVTSYLEQKVGRYLKQGEVFAVAEDNRTIRGEMRIPEYNVGEFSLGGTVEVKLLAYPDKPIIGKVVSIEPNASNDSTPASSPERTSQPSERFVKVLVDIPNTERSLKAGMSGYAKIEGRTMPLIAAFSRSVVRFVQIELWSWLP